MNKNEIREILARAANENRIDDDIEYETINTARVNVSRMHTDVMSAIDGFIRVKILLDKELSILEGRSGLTSDDANTTNITDDSEELYRELQELMIDIGHFCDRFGIELRYTLVGDDEIESV